MTEQKENEIVEIWQPVTSLKGKHLDSLHFVEVMRHNDFFQITLQDLEGNLVDIIYDDPQKVCSLEYVVWSFRYGTELGALGKHNRKMINTNNRKDENAIYFAKVLNSNYIKAFDNNPIANQTLFPNVEHHLYATGDEILEVITNYEPRFIERPKK
ncbi:hypothetical protein [Ornithinibacillus contaminans]|uniref:hypothetical protein n=1 Tax=Ornithinibacillus contaminans TaxID=694055 RepID=UPI00064E0D2C|nr:hypothetical protein [Ornithinibacillus contaminans]